MASLDKDILKKISELRGLAEHARALARTIENAEAREKMIRSASELERQAAVLAAGSLENPAGGTSPENPLAENQDTTVSDAAAARMTDTIPKSESSS